MKRALSILLVTAGTALGQSPVLIQNLLLSGAAAAASAPVNNVGQIGHSAYLTFTNAPAQTCTTPAATGQLEYSFDNSTWTPFGSPQSSSTVGSGQAYIGQGGFGYIRFNLVSFDTTHCRATVWYVGTSQPLAVQITGALGVASVQTCSQAVAFSISTGSNSTIVAKPSAGSIHVCGFTAISGSAAGTITFGYGATTGSGCVGSSGGGSGTDIPPTYNYPALTAGSLVVGSSALGQIFTSPAGNNLCADNTGANTVTGTVFYSIY